MSQLANVHQQVVPMRTACALPLDNVTFCSPNCLFSKPSNICVSAPQYSKVILRAREKLKEFEWKWTWEPRDSGLRGFILFCMCAISCTTRYKIVRNKEQFLANLSSLIHVRWLRKGPSNFLRALKIIEHQHRHDLRQCLKLDILGNPLSWLMGSLRPRKLGG